MDRYRTLIPGEEGQIVTLSFSMFKEAFETSGPVWKCVCKDTHVVCVCVWGVLSIHRIQRAVSNCNFAVHSEAKQLFGLPCTESVSTNRPVRWGQRSRLQRTVIHVMFYVDPWAVWLKHVCTPDLGQLWILNLQLLGGLSAGSEHRQFAEYCLCCTRPVNL